VTTTHIGKPISRVDGRAKVIGEAKYAADYQVPNLAYGKRIRDLPITPDKLVG
jgi:xanthine dehydrogenase YagR molybdenum-binding subunit